MIHRRNTALWLVAAAIGGGLVFGGTAAGYNGPPGTSPDKHVRNVFVHVIGPSFVRPGQSQQYEFDLVNSQAKTYKSMTLKLFMPKQKFVSKQLYVQQGVQKMPIREVGQNLYFSIGNVRESNGLTADIDTVVSKTASGTVCNTIRLNYAPGKWANYPIPCVSVVAD